MENNQNLKKVFRITTQVILATAFIVILKAVINRSTPKEEANKDHIEFMPNTIDMGTIYTFKGSPLRTVKTELPVSMQSNFKMDFYYISLNEKYDISTFCYDLQVINPDIKYSIEGGLEGAISQVSQSLNYSEISKKINTENNNGEIDGLFLSKDDTIRIAFKGKVTKNYVSYFGYIAPKKHSNILDSLFTLCNFTRE